METWFVNSWFAEIGFWLIDVYWLSTWVLAVALILGGYRRDMASAEHRIRCCRVALFSLLITSAVAACPTPQWSVAESLGIVGGGAASVSRSLLTAALLCAGPLWGAWLLAGAYGAKRLIDSGRPAPAWVAELASGLDGLVLESDAVDEPLAVGCLRPRVLVPARWVEERRIEFLRAALLHEREHIRRGDVRMLAFCRALSLILFAHPLFWRLRRTLAADQELLADRAAARELDRVDYARMLIEWARRSRAPLLANALAAVSRRISVLRRRVEALLSPPAAEPEREGRWSLIGVAVTAVVLSLFTWRPDVGLLIESSVASRVDRLDRSEMQTPQPTRAFPSQVAATPIVSPYLISLQPNVSVELLGVADRQANVQWWSPDGEPLDCLPSESQFISMGDGREAIVLWHDSEPPAKVDAATSRLAADVSQGLFRIGHTEGQWINRHVVDMIAGFDCGGMEVSWCDEADDICVSVGGSKRDEAVRVVAIDQCGVLHEAAVIDRFDGEITVSFKNLPFDLVDELIVQTRPLHWVEVPNVALAPTGDESV